jgi:hypothetical protein
VGEGVVNHAPQRGGSVGAGDGGEEVMKVGGCDGGGDMSVVFTLFTDSRVGRRLGCGWGCVVEVLEVLFIFSTVGVCAIGMVRCAVFTLCSVFTLFTVFAVMTIWGLSVGLCTVVLSFGSWVGVIMWAGGWCVCALEGGFVR